MTTATRTPVYGPHLELSTGGHMSPEEGMCLVEAASFLAGEKFGDHPACVCRVIACFCRNINDGLFRKDLERLAPYAPRIVGTVDLTMERARGLFCADWACREAVPLVLDALGLAPEIAAALRALSPFTTVAAVQAAASWMGVLREDIPQDKVYDALTNAQFSALYSVAGETTVNAAVLAAGLAAETIICPPTTALQDSALGLLDRLIALSGEEAHP